MKSIVEVKSRFFGWKETTPERALEHATWMYRTLHPRECRLDTLVSQINNRFRGIQFTKEQLHENKKNI